MVAKSVHFDDKRLLKLFDRFWPLSSQKVKPRTTQTLSTARGPTQPSVPDAQNVFTGEKRLIGQRATT